LDKRIEEFKKKGITIIINKLIEIKTRVNDMVEQREEQEEQVAQGGKNKKNKKPTKPTMSIKPIKPTITGKKDILGKQRCIYKKSGDRKEYVKYKGDLITVKDYKKIISVKKTKK
jgi:hypothetical protein